MKVIHSHIRNPVPNVYHSLLHIGETNRKGSIIDFKVPPVIVDLSRSIDDYKKIIFREHIDAEKLPMKYKDTKNFILLRPTALPYRSFVREQLMESDLLIHEEFALDNFIRFSDTLYKLNPRSSFHWQWRAIVKSLHETGTQDQNTAYVFTLEDKGNLERSHSTMVALKKSMREDMGEVPVILKYKGRPEIALGIHHLHSPEIRRIPVEYNALMHARNKTSVFF